jgi:hypothetical protein
MPGRIQAIEAEIGASDLEPREVCGLRHNDVDAIIAHDATQRGAPSRGAGRFAGSLGIRDLRGVFITSLALSSKVC